MWLLPLFSLYRCIRKKEVNGKKNLVLLISTKCHNNTFVRAASFFKCMQFARELKSYIYTLRASIHKIIFSSMKSSYLRAVLLWIMYLCCDYFFTFSLYKKVLNRLYMCAYPNKCPRNVIIVCFDLL